MKILKICTFKPHLVEFISKTVKYRGNFPTYKCICTTKSSQHNPFNNQSTTKKNSILDEKKILYTIQIYEI